MSFPRLQLRKPGSLGRFSRTGGMRILSQPSMSNVLRYMIALGKAEIPMADLVTFLAFYPFIQCKPHLIKIRKTPPLLQKLCYKWSGSALIQPEDWDW